MINLNIKYFARGMQSIVCVVLPLMNLLSLTNVINVIWTSIHLKRKQ